MITIQLENFKDLYHRFDAEEYPEWIFLRFIAEKEANVKKNQNGKRILIFENDINFDKIKLEKLEQKLLNYENKINSYLFLNYDFKNRNRYLLKLYLKNYHLNNYKIKEFKFNDKHLMILYDIENQEIEHNCNLLNLFFEEKNNLNININFPNYINSTVKKILRKKK